MEIIIALIAVLLTLVWIRYYITRKRNHPGPLGIPFFGSMPWVCGMEVLRYIHIMGKKYDDVFSVQIGTQKFLIMNSYESMKEAYIDKGDIFNYRPDGPFYQAITDGNGIVFLNGEKLWCHRRFTLKSLRKFGFGQSMIEDKIMQETEFIEPVILEEVGKPVKTKDVFIKGVTNIIFVFLFGERFNYGNDAIDNNIKMVEIITEWGRVSDALPLFFPFLCSLPMFKPILDRDPFCKAVVVLKNFFADQLRIYKQKYDPKDDPTNLIECYLEQQAKLSAKGESHTFDDDQIVGMCSNLFIAGIDTTTSSITWALVMASINPDMQKLIHGEIDEVIGNSRRPNLGDRKKLHYCQAFMDEVMRYASVVHMSVERKAVKDTFFRGYQIESTTNIYSNVMGGVHFNPKYWDSPEKFNPERFLTSERVYQPSQYLIPFGMGKRNCLGESLAQQEYFLFFMSAMQRFSVRLDAESLKNIDTVLDGTWGSVHAPGEHHVIFTKR